MSKINNADRPAKPFQEVTGMVGGIPTGYKNHTGLTKREQFAMAAPDAPTWFKNHLYKEDLLYRQAESKGASESGSYLFFAWRTYYADALLAELEK